MTAADEKKADETKAEDKKVEAVDAGVTTKVGEKDVDVKTLVTDVKARTSDADDPNVDWTNQAHDDDGAEKAPVVEVKEPGQVFLRDELPDRKVVEAAGIDYDQFVAGLPVRDKVRGEAPRKGIPS